MAERSMAQDCKSWLERESLVQIQLLPSPIKIKSCVYFNGKFLDCGSSLRRFESGHTP
jgi:hypothetical protein